MPSVAGRSARPLARVRPTSFARAGLAAALAATLLAAPRAADAQCPPSAPFMCPQGSCVQGAEDCASVEGCPPSAPYRCSAGRCAPSEASCDAAGATPTTLWFGPPEERAAAGEAPEREVDEETAVDEEGAVGDVGAAGGAPDEQGAGEGAERGVVVAETIAAHLADGLACPETHPVGCELDVCCELTHPWCCGNGLCGADDACATYTGGLPAMLVMTPAEPGAAGFGELGDEALDAGLGDETASGALGGAGLGDEAASGALGGAVPGGEAEGAGGGDGFAFTGGLDDAARDLLAEEDAGVGGGALGPVGRGPDDAGAVDPTTADLGAVGATDDGNEAARGCDPSTETAASASTATTLFLWVTAVGLLVATLARMRRKQRDRREGRRFAVARY